ncbi:hypothetical protein [Nonomuraea sp. NPDC049709]|uniref:hypothetical protein n=1 Tax=Nonomuraea sp. NPDC049709 TaxID=3154736 RepID=UPI003420A9B7
MRRIAAALAPAALLTAYALVAASPALAVPALVPALVPARVPALVPARVPAWVPAGECTDDGGTVTPVGEGMAICLGGTWDQQLVHAN